MTIEVQMRLLVVCAFVVRNYMGESMEFLERLGWVWEEIILTNFDVRHWGFQIFFEFNYSNNEYHIRRYLNFRMYSLSFYFCFKEIKN